MLITNFSPLTAPGRASTCEPNPCQNGGQCVEQGSSYKCLCKEGFSGTNCELSTGLEMAAIQLF